MNPLSRHRHQLALLPFTLSLAAGQAHAAPVIYDIRNDWFAAVASAAHVHPVLTDSMDGGTDTAADHQSISLPSGIASI